MTAWCRRRSAIPERKVRLLTGGPSHRGPTGRCWATPARRSGRCSTPAGTAGKSSHPAADSRTAPTNSLMTPTPPRGTPEWGCTRGCPFAPPRPSQRPLGGPARRRATADPYVTAIVRVELQRVAHAGRGGHNAAVFTAARALGQLIGAHVLDRARVEDDLTHAAQHIVACDLFVPNSWQRGCCGHPARSSGMCRPLSEASASCGCCTSLLYGRAYTWVILHPTDCRFQRTGGEPAGPICVHRREDEDDERHADDGVQHRGVQYERLRCCPIGRSLGAIETESSDLPVVGHGVLPEGVRGGRKRRLAGR